ncbi:hypothetical protein QUB56_28555 [Microcoleus sp. AR_TQ3_B6]|uniref:hypothetical protein n=1 Tax=Microcoleus sp. AR_TQ3_B6 TaxID=3055284 RepID=UPI002FD6F1AE
MALIPSRQTLRRQILAREAVGDTTGVSGLYNESSQMRSFAAAPSVEELLY